MVSCERADPSSPEPCLLLCEWPRVTMCSLHIPDALLLILSGEDVSYAVHLTVSLPAQVICEMATAAMALSVYKRFQKFPCIIHNNPLFFSRKPDPKVNTQTKVVPASLDSAEVGVFDKRFAVVIHLRNVQKLLSNIAIQLCSLTVHQPLNAECLMDSDCRTSLRLAQAAKQQTKTKTQRTQRVLILHQRGSKKKAIVRMPSCKAPTRRLVKTKP